ncbi:MAG: PA14 domain-containing protein [Sulfolobales archaeon]
MNGLRGFYSVFSEEESIDQEIKRIKNRYIYERIDPEINFIFYDKEPVPGIDLERMIVKWEGFLDVRRRGIYRFFLLADDGARLYLDRELIVDAWENRSLDRIYSRDMKLERDVYRIELEYYNTGVFGKIELGWRREGGVDEIIPSRNLFTYSASSIIITNPPKNSRIKLIYNGFVREAFIKGGIALIPVYDIADGRDGEGRILLFNDREEIIYTSPIIEDMSPGDIYSLESIPQQL